MDLWLFPIIKSRSCATVFVSWPSLVADGQKKQRTAGSGEREQMILLW